MKRGSILLLMSALITFGFFSCTSKTVKIEEKSLVKRYYLDKDTTKGVLSLDFDIEIPTAYADTNVLKAIHDTVIINIFGRKYLNVHKDSLLKVVALDYYKGYLSDNKSIENAVDTTHHYTLNNEHTISGYSLLSDKSIYVYGIERYVDLGGAHGNETRIFFNFDLKTGKLIHEQDLFQSGFEKPLTDLIKARILEDIKSAPQEKNSEAILSLDDTDYWTESIKPNGNFYITDEGIAYVFNTYEIAPYQMGQTEVALPYSKIKKLLKPNSLVAYLVEKDAKSAK